MKTRAIIRNLLLAFVLVSIGFALGKEAALRRQARRESAATGPSGRVIVLYAHSTIRCITCNAMEKMALEVVRGDFAAELAAGRLEWRTADYQEDESTARRYGIASSGLVIVRDDAAGSFQRLDDLWELAGSPEKFKDRVRGAIRQTLRGGGV